MYRIFIITISAFAILGGVIWLGVHGGSDNADEKAADFEKFASVVLKDYSGEEVSLAEFRGSPMVINSWAVWCPFCREELAAFAELQDEFEDEIVVVAIDRQEPLAKVKGFTDELGVTNDMLFLLDQSDTFYRAIGGFSMPETIFVDSEGDIIVHKRGPMDLAEMREHVNKILP